MSSLIDVNATDVPEHHPDHDFYQGPADMDQQTTRPPAAVYQAIARVQAALATEGIGKDRRNKEQQYQFRGIDDIYNAVSRHLADAGLNILPRVLERTQTERTTKSGNPLFSVVVLVEFDFVAAADGSRHIVRTYGEAMDTADKATNKAMSAAYKYALLMAFAIPTEGDNDADNTTHDVGRHERPPQQSPQPVPHQPHQRAEAMTEEQAARTEIEQLIASTGSERERVAAAAGAVTIEAMTEEQAARALSMLRKKAQRAAAERAQQEAA